MSNGSALYNLLIIALMCAVLAWGLDNWVGRNWVVPEYAFDPEEVSTPKEWSEYCNLFRGWSRADLSQHISNLHISHRAPIMTCLLQPRDSQ